MMIDELEKQDCIDKVARLFVLALSFNIHPQNITDTIARSSFIKQLETNRCNELRNNSVKNIFYHYFNIPLQEDFSINNYNDAYWCGEMYMNLFFHFNKPFSYIFLKLPLKELLSKYEVYHQMDVSQLYEYFKEIENDKTIIMLLLEKYGISLKELSDKSRVAYRTLENYKKSDEILYKASYENIQRIVLALDEVNNLFLSKL